MELKAVPQQGPKPRATRNRATLSCVYCHRRKQRVRTRTLSIPKWPPILISLRSAIGACPARIASCEVSQMNAIMKAKGKMHLSIQIPYDRRGESLAEQIAMFAPPRSAGTISVAHLILSCNYPASFTIDSMPPFPVFTALL
jgi:hypothetical protein